MDDLLRFPDNWEVVPIRELGEVKLGRQRAPRFTLGNNPKPYLRVVNIFDGKLDLRDVKSMDFTEAELRQYRLEHGDVLLTEGDLGSAYNVGRSAVYRSEISDCCFTNTLIRFRKFDDGSPSEYFHYVFELLRRHGKFAETTAATTVFHLSSGRLKEVLAPVAPVPQQRKISRILTTLDELIEKTEALIAKYQVIKQGLMHDLFTRGVDEHGQLRPSYEDAPELYKESELGWIPKEWEVRTIGECFEIQLGKMLSRASKTGKNAFPYLANRNVQWDQFDLSDLETMDFTNEERHKFALHPGDLLVCEGGEVGRTAMWNGEKEECYYQKAIHRMRPKEDSVLPLYMLRIMRFAAIGGWFTNFTSQTSIAHLTREKLVTVPIMVPSQEEQRLVAERFDAIDKQLLKEKRLLSKLSLQKHGLMNDLLTGEVQVTLDQKESSTEI